MTPNTGKQIDRGSERRANLSLSFGETGLSARGRSPGLGFESTRRAFPSFDALRTVAVKRLS